MSIWFDDRLRPYQRDAVNELAAYLSDGENKGKSPCLVMPTASGKSWIIATMIRSVLEQKHDARVLVLSHVKELLEQDAGKILAVWPGAPLGIYSAGLGRREIAPVTVAGIQSVFRRADELKRVDFAIVDEAHLINTSAFGMYRTLFSDLRGVWNPDLPIVGLTATPYRTGQGLLTEGECPIFDDLIAPESCSIEALQDAGYLAHLRSKHTDMQLSTQGVKIRGGDFSEKDLAAALDSPENNAEIVTETIARAESRRAWLFFCTGVAHARHVCDELNRQGVTAACVTGKTPKDERARILGDFRAGKIRALTNANVLTTGFDHPDIDVLVFARPTLSPGLYVQMAGRGMRLKHGADGAVDPSLDCLVLDFAGNVMRHGPIYEVKPTYEGANSGKEKTKTCPMCKEVVPVRLAVCPACGYEFPKREQQEKTRRAGLVLDENADIEARGPREMEVRGWDWRCVMSRRTGQPMLIVNYQPRDERLRGVSELICPLHDGYAGEIARQMLKEFAKFALAELPPPDTRGALFEIAAVMTASPPPARIRYKSNGKYLRMLNRTWTRWR